MSGWDEVDESLLDDQDRLLAADPQAVLRALAGAGATVRRTAAAAAEAGAGALTAIGLPRAVVLIGAQQARLAAEAMVVFAGPHVPVPFVVHGGEELPRWVGAADLVLVASSQGDDPVACRAAAAAGGRGAQVCAVGPPDSPLAAAVAGARGIFVPDASPDGFWGPFAGLLCLLRDTGLITAPDELLDLLIERMDDRAVQARPSSESFLNPAKSLAISLAGTVPMVGSATAAGLLAARRFRDSLARMAGCPAVLYHSGYLGGGFAGSASEEDIFRDRVEEPDPLRLHAVLLREEESDPAVDAMQEHCARAQIPVSEVILEPGPDPVRFARAVAELDFAAAYLAILSGVDPAGAVDSGTLSPGDPR